MVVSIWIPYNSAAKEHITKKASRTSTSIKSRVLLRSNFESHSESPLKSERDMYEIPTAAGYSSADVSAGIVNQDNTTSDQPGYISRRSSSKSHYQEDIYNKRAFE